MAKKTKTKKVKEPEIILTMFPLIMEPKIHPNEEQEDPINGKFSKTIEITPFGADWR